MWQFSEVWKVFIFVKFLSFYFFRRSSDIKLHRQRMQLQYTGILNQL